MSDCQCATVKYYADHDEWRCMLCYQQFMKVPTAEDMERAWRSATANKEESDD